MEIGRVIGTEKKPNTAYTFTFWTNTAQPVGIGTLVKVVAEEATVYGTVVEAHGFNDLESPLHEFLSVGGDAELEPPTLRPEMRVYMAAVLRREPEEPISAVPIGRVYLADEQDVRMALRTDGYAEEFGIPVGCYGPRDAPVAVHLHSEFLLGPESGHLNMTGTSGLAAKTSFILYLLSSIFQRKQSVAALLFNTKGGDLLYIDEEPAPGSFDAGDQTLYDACGLEAKPFQSVRYYAPFDRAKAQPATLRRNEQLEGRGNATRRFSFGLREVIKHAEVLLNRDDLDAKADAYLQYLNERFIEDASPIAGQGDRRRAETLDQLCEIVEAQLRHAELNNQTQIESHSIFTVRKMRNRLSNLGRRFSGLVAERGGECGPFDAPFEPGTVYVVDVSQLDSESQDLVFAAFITTLRERMEEQKLGVERLVVVVDELNKYAPSGGQETYVVKALKDIAARGRYMGLTLFGAQQFRSRVDKEVVGNSATHAFGHVEAEELAQPGYSYFSPAVKEKLGSLSPGEVLIKHPHFTQPIFIRFPRPACLRGSDGMRLYPAQERVPLTIQLLNEVKRMKAPANECRDLISNLSQDEANLLDVLLELKKLPDSADPIPVLRRGKKPVAAFAGRSPRAVIEEVDPFAD